MPRHWLTPQRRTEALKGWKEFAWKGTSQIPKSEYHPKWLNIPEEHPKSHGKVEWECRFTIKKPINFITIAITSLGVYPIFRHTQISSISKKTWDNIIHSVYGWLPTLAFLEQDTSQNSNIFIWWWGLGKIIHQMAQRTHAKSSDWTLLQTPLSLATCPNLLCIDKMRPHLSGYGMIWRFPKSWVSPQSSSILIWFSIINHLFWGTPFYINLYIRCVR